MWADSRAHVHGRAGQCYTLIALGGPGITELDAQASFASPIPVPLGQYQDNQTGPNATIGGGGNCVRNNPMTAVPMKITLKVTASPLRCV